MSDPRLRLAVHPADRPARARAATSTARSIPFNVAARRRSERSRPRASSSPAGRRASTTRARRCPIPPSLRARRPVLGICYGMQLAATSCSAARSRAAEHREYGAGRARRSTTPATSSPASPRRDDRPVWMSHGDQHRAAAAGLRTSSPTATTRRSPPCADAERRFYGVQFHPEVAPHARSGTQILDNFLFRICRPTPTGRWSNFVERAGRAHPRAGRRRGG